MRNLASLRPRRRVLPSDTVACDAELAMEGVRERAETTAAERPAETPVILDGESCLTEDSEEALVCEEDSEMVMSPLLERLATDRVGVRFPSSGRSH